MKKATKNYWEYTKNIVIPQKSGRHWALLQRTVAICLWATVYFGITAIILEIFHEKNSWLAFLENCHIGIACSLIVVVITGYLQYKHEEEKGASSFFSSLRNLDYAISLRIGDTKEDLNLTAQRGSGLFDYFDEWSDIAFSLYFYNPNHFHEYSNVLKAMWPITNAFLGLGRKTRQDKEESNSISIAQFYNAVKATESFYDSYYKNKGINTFKLLREDLEAILDEKAHSDQL